MTEIKVQTRTELILRDLVVVCCLVLIFFPARDTYSTRVFWAMFFVILSIKQYRVHLEYYKRYKKIF